MCDVVFERLLFKQAVYLDMSLSAGILRSGVKHYANKLCSRDGRGLDYFGPWKVVF